MKIAKNKITIELNDIEISALKFLAKIFNNSPREHIDKLGDNSSLQTISEAAKLAATIEETL